MNSPYMGKFKVTQKYGKNHDGLDLVGIDSKNVHSTINGKVVYAGWENSKNEKQGFGKYVKIKKNGTNDYYYFGHLKELKVKTGDKVKITDIIGVEGSTGNAIGSHCHYCIRMDGRKGKDLDVASISGIPNTLGTYDDGYRPTNQNNVRIVLTPLNLRNKPSYTGQVIKVMSKNAKVIYLGMEKGWAKVKYENLTGYCGSNYLKK